VEIHASKSSELKKASRDQFFTRST